MIGFLPALLITVPLMSTGTAIEIALLLSIGVTRSSRLIESLPSSDRGL